MTFAEKFNINSKKNSTILVAPLDWGLGHATRCIPIIKHLISIDCEIIIAAEGLQRSLLEEEFPQLQFVQLNGYRLKFGSKGWKTFLKILLQIPNILVSINKERLWLKNFLLQHKIDAVISDNRYGLNNRKTVAVFITHQLTIKTPFGIFLENSLRRLNYHFIQKFDECWVPDFEGNNNMGGELSHPGKMPLLPVKFIGRLSRIEEGQSVKGIELLIILSGPEPQRSIFEKLLMKQLDSYLKPSVLVRGLPGEKKLLISPHKNLSIYNHLASDALNKLIHKATFIISRPGYSTVMDLAGLSKKCIFVPTPGQTEQEYLAHYLYSKKICISFPQDNFSLDQALRAAHDSHFQHFEHAGNGLYKRVLTDFITSLNGE